MNTIRDELKKKYTVSTASRSTAPVSSGNKYRDDLVAKYTAPKKTATKTVTSSTPTYPASTKVLEPTKKIETISAPKEPQKKTLLQKAGGLIKKGLEKVNLIDTDEEKFEKDRAAYVLTRSLNDRQYLEIGKQLNLQVDPQMPATVDPKDKNVVDFYTNKAIVEQVKNNFPQIKEAFQLEDPDQLDEAFVKKNFDAITKEIGLRDKMTNKEFFGTVVTLGLGVGVAAPIALGAKALPFLMKTGLGLAGFEALNAADRMLYKKVTGEEGTFAEGAVEKGRLGETGELLVYTADLFAKGAVLHGAFKKGPVVYEKLTKDIITQYKLPTQVQISPEKIRSIFQTGEKISAQELDFVKSLGLDGKGYREAMNNGVTISVPSEKIVSLVDKPYWGKVKSLFNVEPTNKVLSKTKGGETTQAPVGLIEGPSGKPLTVPESIAGADSPNVQTVFKSPLNAKVLQTIKEFSPVESSAFGQKIIQRMNAELGTKFEKAGDLGNSKAAMKFNDFESKDGRPAQITNGKIEIFLPNLMKSIKALADGGQILAHAEIPQYSKVYKLQPGETIDQLAIRYTNEVLVHELAHDRTITREDATKMQTIQDSVSEALASKNEKAITMAETARDQYLKTLEEKALEYEKVNKDQLQNDLFGKKGDSTTIQRTIDRAIKGGKEEKVTVSEKKLVKERFKQQAIGAKAGKAEGRKIGKEESAEVRNLYRDIVEKIRDKNESQTAKRKMLTDYAKAFVPIRVRGKFLKSITNVKTDKEFLKVLERMKVETDTARRSGLMREIQRELKSVHLKFKNGKPVSKLDVTKQRMINSIIETQKKYEQLAKNMRALGNKDASAYDLATRKRADLLFEWQEKNPGKLPSAELLHEIEILRTVGIKNMTAKELRDALSIITTIKEQGKTKRETDLFNRETERQRVNEKIIDDISGGKEKPSSAFLVRPKEKELNYKELIEKGYGYLVYEWESHLDKISFNDKTSQPFKSTVSRLGRKIKNAESLEIEGREMKIDEFRAGIEKAYNTKTDKELETVLQDLGKQQDIGTFKNSEGKNVKILLTKDQAIKAHMLFQAEVNDVSFEKMLWTEEIKQEITNSLSAEDLAYADYLLKDFYTTYPERINEVHVKLTGTDLFFIEDGTYSPAFKDVEQGIPASVLLAKENFSYATAKTGSLKARVDNSESLKIPGATEEAIKHLVNMEHYIAYEPVLSELRAVFTNKEVRANIEEFYGKEMVGFFDNALNDFARGGIDPVKVIKPIDALRTNTTVAMLGIFSTVKVPLKQLVGTMNFLMELSLMELTVGIFKFWLHPIKNYEFLFENSALIRQRYAEGFDIAMKEALEKGFQEKLSKKDKLFSRETMFIGIRNADKLTVLPGAHAAYLAEHKRAIKSGMSEKDAKREAIEYAEDVVDRTQESSPLYTLSEAQRGGSLARAVTMFSSQPVKILRVMSNNIRNIRAGRGDRTKLYKTLMSAYFLAPFVYYQISNMLTPDEYKESQKAIFMRTWLGPFTYIPMLGNIANMLIDKLMGNNFGSSLGTATPALSFADDIAKAIDKLQLEDPKVLESLTYAADALAKIFGKSIGLLTKQVRNAAKEAKEEEDNDGSLKEMDEFKEMKEIEEL